MALAWLAAAWLAGIVLAAMYGWAAWPFALAVAAATLALALWRRDARLIVLAAALPLLMLAGLWRFEAATGPPPASDISRYNDGVHMRISGVVRDDATRGDTSQRFAVSVRAVAVRGEWVDASGGVLVRTGLVPPHRAGDIVELEGGLDTPPALDGFDYAAHLERQGIRSVMEYPATRLVGRDDPPAWRRATLVVRRELSESLSLALPEPEASLARGVLLGERSALPREVSDDLNTTNTSHLVVVSGSNVVLVSAAATLLFAPLFGRRRALALSVAAVLAYAMLVGASPPVLRATVMGIVLIGAQLAGRPSSGLTSIMLAAALMCGLEPTAIEDVSFQLSFAATAGIIYLSRPLRSWTLTTLALLLRRDTLPRWTAPLIAEPLAVTLAAIATTTPLIAMQFGRMSVVGIAANMLVVPAFPLILGASLLAALGGLLPEGRLIFATPAHYLLAYWLEVTRWLASMPHAAVNTHGFDRPQAVAAYGAVGAGAYALVRWLPRPESRLAESQPFELRRFSRVAAFTVPMMVLATSAGFALWPSHPARLEVTVLDVGQGDAILIETPSGRDILVDGGPGPAVLRGLGGEMPWHDRSLDLVVLTHPQADHATGLLDVFARYDVRRVMVGDAKEPRLLDAAWRDAVSRQGLRIEPATAGTTLDLGDGVMLEVLWPQPGATLDANNASAVLRLSWGDVAFLLTGDIEREAEAALVASGVDLSATVLKVPHHGSRTSSTRTFLDAVQPSVSVASAGATNRFGHPRWDVLARLQQYGDTFITARDGAVHFETDGTRIWITTSR